MYDLKKIDLGNDEAEQDYRLQEYFLKTHFYQNALTGKKTLVIGRKGSGKSAIFILLEKELLGPRTIVIPITPDQYSWSALKDYTESGILPEQAHTNAWRLTLLSAIIWKLNENMLIPKNSKLVKYFQYMRDTYVPAKQEGWFLHLVQKGKSVLSSVNTHWVSFDFGETSTTATPLRIIDETQALLLKDWPNTTIRILIDRLDDSWDSSEQSKFLIIGLLKAANSINTAFAGRAIVTTFLRSDIYDNLFFDDQDKLRQYEELLIWDSDGLKDVVAERVKVSLGKPNHTTTKIWSGLFSTKPYRSRASAEKYIIDRTFKRPRDVISFVRFAIEKALSNGHAQIEPNDTRLAEEEKYSQSKFKDLIIENQRQFPFTHNLLNSFSGSLHKVSIDDLQARLALFTATHSIKTDPNTLIRLLFTWGVLGVKKQGRAGVKHIGGAHFFYSYDDPSINPLSEQTLYFHPALRHYLNISEKREKLSRESL